MRIWKVAGCCVVAVAAVAMQQSFQERRVTQSANAEKAGLAEPFKGITTDGTLREGLFPLRSTGVSTEPVQRAVLDLIRDLAPAPGADASVSSSSLRLP